MAMKMLWMTVCLMSVATLVRAGCDGENGVTYPDNTGPYPAGDGCNTCKCTNGAMVCTQNSCGCMYHARGLMWIAEGSTVVGNEGCTRCTCSGGEMSCTYMNCSCRGGDGTWVESGAFHQPDCNRCKCFNNKLTCTLISCPGCKTDTGYHEINTSWTAKDGCNTCRCTMMGNFGRLRRAISVCTHIACTQTEN